MGNLEVQGIKHVPSKIANLQRLADLGVPVPRSRIVVNCSDDLKSPQVESELKKLFDHRGEFPVIVRSAHSMEDSFAGGAFESIVVNRVRGQGFYDFKRRVEFAISEVFKSAKPENNPEVRRFINNGGSYDENAMSVLINEYYDEEEANLTTVVLKGDNVTLKSFRPVNEVYQQVFEKFDINKRQSSSVNELIRTSLLKIKPEFGDVECEVLRFLANIRFVQCTSLEAETDCGILDPFDAKVHKRMDCKLERSSGIKDNISLFLRSATPGKYSVTLPVKVVDEESFIRERDLTRPTLRDEQGLMSFLEEIHTYYAAILEEVENTPGKFALLVQTTSIPDESQFQGIRLPSQCTKLLRELAKMMRHLQNMADVLVIESNPLSAAPEFNFDIDADTFRFTEGVGTPSRHVLFGEKGGKVTVTLIKTGRLVLPASVGPNDSLHVSVRQADDVRYEIIPGKIVSDTCDAVATNVANNSVI